ncbi:exodeoxyribonuclease VII small subunit [Bacillus taeanensis]|uniref:Exodeoxyribonuclease 7 small subunit n=1 Tax=Bacillus taeanensis TaxID=273032 RepID=A0A366XW33_9BACI|nr:exodeoxyribonuclease VII small subunit [Bacillus taeanensis]RBW70610.1 exodeoxyribonuclease VII small subunit [Bacillus taeanensis]
MTEEQNKEKQVTFEEAMEKLEEIVDRLESGNVPLEEAINLFQDGMLLSKQCHEKLKTIEGKIDRMIDENGEEKMFSIEEAE